jgi:hypothetical protein
LKEVGFNYLETRSLNQDPLENIFGVIRLHCGANNPTVGRFVDAMKTSINGLAYADLRNSIQFPIVYLMLYEIYNLTVTLFDKPNSLRNAVTNCPL